MLERKTNMAVSNGTNSKYDVIVIGGGHNGLVNAAYLARAGKKVLVLERRHVLGGAAVHRRDFPRLQVFGLLLRGLAAASGDYPRPRSSAPWPGDSSARRHFHSHAERRLSLARERPRQDSSRDRPPLQAGRRSLRRIRQSDAGHVPLREADSQHGAA